MLQPYQPTPAFDKPQWVSADFARILERELIDAAPYIEIGKRWRANNSLEEWFPFSAEKLAQLTSRGEEWEKWRYKKSLMLARKFADAVGQTDEEKICLMAAQIAEDLAA